MANIYTSAVLVGLCLGSATGIVNIHPEKKEKIDNFANSLLFDCDKHNDIVGMNLAIVHEGEVLYTTGYGIKNLGKYFSELIVCVRNKSGRRKFYTRGLFVVL